MMATWRVSEGQAAQNMERWMSRNSLSALGREDSADQLGPRRERSHARAHESGAQQLRVPLVAATGAPPTLYDSSSLRARPLTNHLTLRASLAAVATLGLIRSSAAAEAAVSGATPAQRPPLHLGASQRHPPRHGLGLAHERPIGRRTTPPCAAAMARVCARVVGTGGSYVGNMCARAPMHPLPSPLRPTSARAKDHPSRC